MSRDTLLTLVRGANPVPDSAAQPADELAALVSAIERRTSMVKQQDRRTDVVSIGAEQPRRRRTGLMVAAAAFAVVIGVVGVIAALSDDGGPKPTVPPVTTETSTSTTAEPTTTTIETSPDTTVAPGDQAVIDGVVAAYNAGDIDGVLSYFGPETLYLSGVIDILAGPQAVATWPDAVRGDLVWRAAIESTLLVESCHPDGSRVICDVVSGSRLFDLRGGVPGRLTLEVAGDEFTEFVLDETQGFVDQAFIPFQRWLREHHAEDFDTMLKQDLDAGAGQPHLTEESIVLWTERLAEYEEFVWRSDVDPEDLAVLDGLVAAFNAEDFTAFSSYFTCDTIYRSDITDTGSAGGGNPSNQTLCDIGEETLERSMRFRAAKAQELTVLGCMTLEEGTTRCEIVLGGPFFGLRGGVRGSLEIATTAGMLDLYAIESYVGQTETVELPFRNWIDANHPEDSLAVWSNLPTDEAIAVYENRLPEYLATLEG